MPRFATADSARQNGVDRDVQKRTGAITRLLGNGASSPAESAYTATGSRGEGRFGEVISGMADFSRLKSMEIAVSWKHEDL
jgi:hypothetical protein